MHPVAAAGFASAADVYERARPSYPAAAVAWIAERAALGPGRTVLDLGAGTGKLTRLLVPTGARVIAVEPLAEMRAKLEEVVPGVVVLEGTAEDLPLGDGSIDVVTCAQAFHWFDLDLALPELHRVLAADGLLVLVWNTRDLDDPLQGAIEELLGPYRSVVSAPVRRRLAREARVVAVVRSGRAADVRLRAAGDRRRRRRTGRIDVVRRGAARGRAEVLLERVRRPRGRSRRSRSRFPTAPRSLRSLDRVIEPCDPRVGSKRLRSLE